MIKPEIKILDFKLLKNNPTLLTQLRKLTIHNSSGLNYELTTLLAKAKYQNVNAKIFLAYVEEKLVGWALFSMEPSNGSYIKIKRGFNIGDGVLFQLYIHPKYRRQGIGTQLTKIAKRKANGRKLCIFPWDHISNEFFNQDKLSKDVCFFNKEK